ncbi:hypothetical protein BCV52_26605 [Priestia aryabhattai]|nr:hypothetical protein BCV52_26605 [Priestia aryabhattai]
MRKNSERKIPHARKKLLLNLNTINSFKTFMLTRKIKGKVVKKRLKPGILSRKFLEAINTSLIIKL